jgi:2-polyprenyl-3-methyl-5-hydroxy-6-metoxy-1,4-benzoquinol methylase
VTDQSRAKRLIGSIYSRAADTLYEPLVVNGAFRLFGANVHELVLEQGRKAVMTAAGAPILDLPVGTGFFTLQIAPPHPGIVVGTDIAAGMTRETKRAATERGVDNVFTVQADAHRLPYADGVFGAVMCTNGLQVMPGLQATIDELYRVTTPTATVFVSLIVAAIGAILPKTTRASLPTLLRPAEDVRAAFVAAGFQVDAMHRARMAALMEATKPA